MGRRSKDPYVTLRTRVPREIYLSVAARATAGYPPYRVVRDIIVAHIAGADGLMSPETYKVLSDAATATGYAGVDALLKDLTAAFLRVYRYNTGQLEEEESTPAEEIREMFEEMDASSRIYEEGLSVRKGT